MAEENARDWAQDLGTAMEMGTEPPASRRTARRQPAARYLVVRLVFLIAANALGIGLAVLLDPHGQAGEMAVLMGAVILSGWVGGRLAGLASAAAASWFTLVHTYQVGEGVEFPEDLLRIGGFAATALLVNGVNSAQAAQRRAERAQERAEHAWRWLEAVIERSPSPMALVAAGSGAVVLANRAARHPETGILGTDGMSLALRLPGEDAPTFVRRAGTGEDQDGLRLEVRRDGSLRRFLGSARLVRAPMGPEAVLVSCQDITELEQAREALEASEARYRELMEGAPVGICRADSEGRIVWANTRWRELVGGGEDWSVACTGPEHGALQEAWDAAVQRREALSMELRASGGESPRWLALTLRPVGEAGEDLSFIGALADVTAQRLAAERLARLSDERAQLVSTVSHSLRAPITAMVLNLEVLEDGTVGELTEEQREHVRSAIGAAAELADVVGNLLTLSRLTSGTASLRRSEFDLTQLAREVAARMGRRARDAGLALELDLPAEGVLIRSDATHLSTILTELIENAVKYTPAGGRVQVACKVDQGSAVLEVRDTGRGWSPEEQAHLCTPFFRGSAAMETQAAGTGLGLQIVQQVTALLGGELEFSSRPGAGSAVVVRLPVDWSSGVKPGALSTDSS